MGPKDMEECDKYARMGTHVFVSSVSDCITVFCSFEPTDHYKYTGINFPYGINRLITLMES